MRQPERFKVTGDKEMVCLLLKKSLYGLKQSPKQWYKRFDSFVVSNGYNRSSYDSCVYFKKLKCWTGVKKGNEQKLKLLPSGQLLHKKLLFGINLIILMSQVLNGNPYNRKCDVYSFGICLWEIYCCDMPYPDLSFAEITSVVVRQKYQDVAQVLLQM